MATPTPTPPTPTPPPGHRSGPVSHSPGPSVVEALPPIPAPPLPDDAPATDSPQPHAPVRRGSFGFLKRGKSVERMNSNRSNSGGGNKLTKRQVKEARRAAEREAARLPKEPPQLGGLAAAGPLQAFDGAGDEEDARMSYDGTVSTRSDTAQSKDRSTPYGVPIPPIPGQQKGAPADPYDRTTSMTNRSRVSYASSISAINSPRRVRRRNDPTPFNVLVIGSRNAGKTAFIHFLCHSLAPQGRRGALKKEEPPAQVAVSKFSSNFLSHYLETELDDGETIAITIWDSEGIESSLADLQLREITSFVESKFEETLNEEIKVVRTPGVRDTHIHAVFFLLDPVRLDQNIVAAQKIREKSSNGLFTDGRSYVHPPSPMGLDIGSLDGSMDMAILKALQGKTTVIPVISKADTIPQDHVLELRRSVGESLKQADIDPLENLGLDEDDEGEDETSSEGSDYGRAKLRKDRDEKHHMPNDSAIDDNDDISNQSVLNLSSSSSGRSSATSVAEDTAEKRKRKTNTALFLPHTILSPHPIAAHRPGPGQVSRRFAWGAADPYDTDHCDFVKLKDAVFSEWRTELREASKEIWYENWRTTRLGKAGAVPPRRDLGGPPTTGRGARMGAQILASKGKDSPPLENTSASGSREQGRRARQSPSPAARPRDRASRSPAGGQRHPSPALAPRQPASHSGNSPARGPRDQERYREYSPAGALAPPSAPAGRSPASSSREYMHQPRATNSPHRGHENELRQDPRAGRKPSNEKVAHPAPRGNAFAQGQADLHLAGSPIGPPPSQALPQRPRGMTAEERNQQVPWPLQS